MNKAFFHIDVNKFSKKYKMKRENNNNKSKDTLLGGYHE